MLLLAGYLLFFPPLFVLGPLAGLLAASRPRTAREWAWIGAAGLWLAFTLWAPGGIARQTVYAWALFVTAAFVLLMLAAGRTIVTGALQATLVGFGLATLWLDALGLHWREVQLAVAHAGWDRWRTEVARGGTTLLGAMADVEPAISDGIGALADLFPAVLMLMVLPGLSLAWSWYHRLAQVPLGAPAERFAAFRFSDQLVWGVVLGVVFLLLPPIGPLGAIVSNLSLVIGVLYVARGAAVAWSSIERWPGAVLVLLGVAVLLIFPVALGGCFALGLADTWVDFRRRAAPADLTRE